MSDPVIRAQYMAKERTVSGEDIKKSQMAKMIPLDRGSNM